MKVSQLLEKRQQQWEELERLCGTMASRSGRTAEVTLRFSYLYRDACADLALASSYQLPDETIDYLQRLVAKSHNLLYRSRGFDLSSWGHTFFVTVPQACFRDGCLHIAFLVFWGFFLFGAYNAYHDVEFADRVLGEGQREGVEQSFTDFADRDVSENFFMACFYVWNNAGIGLACFTASVLFLPGLVTLTYNAVVLGTTFGVMFHPDAGTAGVNFRDFVTAHGPFELTAIVLSAGAGLRLGMGWIRTGGLSRLDSILKAGKSSLPMMGCACVLFFGAALIEGFISPTQLPWAFKAFIAVACSILLVVYFVVLGFPRGGQHET